jgi:hypothetical protein
MFADALAEPDLVLDGKRVLNQPAPFALTEIALW